MKKTFVLVNIIFMLIIVNLYSAEKNIFEWNKGVETQPLQAMPNNRDFNSNKEFIAYSEAFRQSKNLLEFHIPPSAPKEIYHFAGLGSFAVTEASVYQLSTRINKLQPLDVAFIFVSFFNGNTSLGTQQLLMIPAKQNTAMIGYFLDFATPTGADKIIIWFGLSGNGKVLKPGISAILTNIKIVKTREVMLADNVIELAGKNLSPVFDFEKEKLGPAPEWEFMKSGSSKYKLEVNIAGNQNEKYLHIAKNSIEKYPWFHFRLPEGDFYYNNLFQLSLRVKGTGKIRLGIWWRKMEQDYEYCNSEVITLTDEWQNIQYELYCNDPVTTSAAIAICLGESNQASVFVDDIKFMIKSSKQTQ